MTKFITGGTFTKSLIDYYQAEDDVNGPYDFIAYGYTAVENDGVYTVEEVKG